MLYVNVPEVVGVPEMVIVLLVQDAVTPGGKPVGVPIPVAPVVVWVILVKVLFVNNVGEEEAPLAVFAGFI